MIYITYIVSAILSQIIDLFSKFLLNWIVAAFADADGNLPRYLYWFQTFDATLDEGMLARKRELAAGLGGKDWDSFNPTPKTPFQIYMNRAKWLFRNSAYGFDYYLFGMAWKPEEWRVVKFVDNESLTLFVAVGRGFNVYAFGRYGMAKIGWKAWNLYDPKTGTFRATWGTGGRIPLTFTINPFSRK